MCVAAPMLIKKIYDDGRTGAVVFSGNEMDVNLNLIPAKVGDYVLVHAGCAVEIIKKDCAEEILEIFTELEEAARGY